MKWLSYKLWKERNSLKPSCAFKLSLWKKLDKTWQETHIQCNFWYQNRVFKYSMVSLVILAVVASSGVGAYAYNSPEVTEGTKLYPIKRAIEKVEEKTKKTPEAKAKFYLKQIQRREVEKDKLEKKSKRQVQLQQLEEKINKTEEQLEKVNTDLVTSSLKDQVKQRLEKRKIKV